MHQLQIFLHLDFGSLVLVLNRGCPWDELELGLHGRGLVVLMFGCHTLLMGLLDGAG